MIDDPYNGWNNVDSGDLYGRSKRLHIMKLEMEKRKMEQGKLEKIIADFDNAKEKYQLKLQKAYKSMLKEYWKRNKKIAGITWVQYTPYFNDGEPCCFGVHQLVPLTKSLMDYDNEGSSEMSGFPDREYGPYQTDWDDPNRNIKKMDWEKSNITLEEWKQACDDLDLIARLPDDVFEDMFGDHVKVTVTRKTIDVEEFEHD